MPHSFCLVACPRTMTAVHTALWISRATHLVWSEQKQTTSEDVYAALHWSSKKKKKKKSTLSCLVCVDAGTVSDWQPFLVSNPTLLLVHMNLKFPEFTIAFPTAKLYFVRNCEISVDSCTLQVDGQLFGTIAHAKWTFHRTATPKSHIYSP